MNKNEIISKIYYNPIFGFRSAKQIYILTKKIDDKITMKDVQNFINNQHVAQVSNVKRNENYNSFIPQYPFEEIQADLVFFKYGGVSKPVLTIVDTFTKIGYAKALASKQPKNVLEGFKEYFSKYKTPTQIFVDGGNEFKGDILDEMEKLKTKIIITTTHAPFIESFNRTIRNIISRWMIATKRKDWWTILDDVITNYNNSIHSTINMTPTEALLNKNKNKVLDNIIDNSSTTPRIIKNKNNLVVGDTVRILLKKKQFSKETDDNYSDELFVIEKIELPYYYLDGKRTKYLRSNLKKVKIVEYYEKPLPKEKTIGFSRKVEDIDSIAVNRPKRQLHPTKKFDNE